MSALLAPRLRVPGRKGLRGIEAAGCDRCASAVRSHDSRLANFGRFPRGHIQTVLKKSSVSRTGSRNAHLLVCGYFDDVNDADTRLCAGSFQLDRPTRRCAGPGCLARRSSKII